MTGLSEINTMYGCNWRDAGISTIMLAKDTEKRHTNTQKYSLTNYKNIKSIKKKENARPRETGEAQVNEVGEEEQEYN